MATTYNVYQNGEKIASNLTSKTYTATDLTPETTYTFQVSAENEGGESPLSTELEVTTDPEPVDPPEAPEGLQATGQSDTTADLEWN